MLGGRSVGQGLPPGLCSSMAGVSDEDGGRRATDKVGDVSNPIFASDLVDGAIVTSELVDGAIVASDLVDGAIFTSEPPDRDMLGVKVGPSRCSAALLAGGCKFVISDGGLSQNGALPTRPSS